MSWLTRFSLKNIIAVFILIFLVAGLGTYTGLSFKQEAFPDISEPRIIVQTPFPGASSQQVEDQVTRPMKQNLEQIEGLKRIQTQSSINFSVVDLYFDDKADVNEKKALVEETLNSISLPEGTGNPEVITASLDNFPVIYAAITLQDQQQGDKLRSLVRDQVIPSLERVEGVSKVDSAGLAPNSVTIDLDINKMKKKGISLQEISQQLKSMNQSMAIGSLQVKDEKQPLVVTGKIESVEELKNLVLRTQPELKLKEVAEITKGDRNRESLSYFQGKPSISLTIHKTTDANTVEMTKEVQKTLDSFEDEAGIDVLYNDAQEIERSIQGVLEKGLLGALLAAIVVMLFLRNLRATLIAIISIPLSILVTLSLIKYFTDITLNIMTLSGMTVAVGRVVDDSIVVIENIARRLQKERVSKELVLDATKEVGRAITSSTITTIAVFLPLTLVSGLIGKMFVPFGLTVVFALLASLLVSITVVPALAYLFMRRGLLKEYRAPKLNALYGKSLKWSLNHKGVVLTLSLVLFLASLPLAGITPFTFMPEQEEKYVQARLEMPEGSSLEMLDKEAKQLDDIIRGLDEVKYSQVVVGERIGDGLGDSSNQADWMIRLKSSADTAAVVDTLKEKLKPDSKDAKLDIFDMAGTGYAKIDITVKGTNTQDIKVATEKITSEIEAIQETEKVENTLVADVKTLEVNIRPKDALANGLTTMHAAESIQPFLSKQKIGEMGEGGQTEDLLLQVTGHSMDSVKEFGKLPLFSADGKEIEVKDIADVKEIDQPSSIQYDGEEPYATITGAISGEDVSAVNGQIRDKIDKLSLPDGVKIEYGGSDEQIQKMVTDMGIAILVAIGVVYLVMVVTFSEGRAPFAILFSLPLAVIGALGAVVLTSQPISLSSMIGMLMLIGIVVTNAIVLIDRVQQQINKGLTIRDALLEAGTTRLRPILMTALATIGALIPLSFGVGSGALVSAGLAVVVIGGLITSTLLTLLIVPVMYELLHRKEAKRQRSQSHSA
ncbi:efflux RND transporter permease subunit [Melghirimyces algeriensis]|uniref:Hydrophobic/amphiphilic exporter-1, HAE1 family n=1 Tax=Melghirimyces algeriensis TaxID=910412 RepID=A0A521FEE2_9BACL|nr:efflux RND transporter permease subunit [Melghirimyces algeriensis]SMO94572.1 hydrophobic/amphiphilic exporter-1, HAE1 family [Melghirimyces algeriensis]